MGSMLAVFAAAAALAQEATPDLDAQLHAPPIDARRFLLIADASAARFGYVHARAGLGWLHRPLVFRYDDGEEVDGITHALGTDIVGAVHFGRIRLGAELPVWLVGTGLGGEATGLGDLAAGLKGTLVDPDQAPFGLAIAARAQLPTHTISLPLAQPGFAWSAHLIAETSLGPVQVVANVGHVGQPESQVAPGVRWDDQLSARLGAGISLDPGRDRVGVSTELQAPPLAGRRAVVSPAMVDREGGAGVAARPLQHPGAPNRDPPRSRRRSAPGADDGHASGAPAGRC